MEGVGPMNSGKITPRGLIPAFLILLAAGYVFAPAVHGGWLWDDDQEVTRNPVLAEPAGLAKIWSGSAGADYFPLKTTVQWVGWRLWGANPAGYHALSILLHVTSAFLFWRLLAKLGLRAAWVGGLLFVVHPLAVESVAWAAELKNTLSLPLLLLAMIAYVDFDQKGSGRGIANPAAGFRNLRPDPFYSLSLALFLLAMLAKSSVVMFPVVILLHAWWRRGRIGAADVRASIPFFAVSAGLGLVTFWFQHHRAMQSDLVLAGGPLSRMACAGLALAFYLGKSVFPFALSPIYPRWEIDPPSLAQMAPWPVFAILIGWLWSGRAGWGRHVLFGLGFFAINLLPVAGLVTISYMHVTWVADHFAYLPLLGVIGLAVAGLGRCASQPMLWVLALLVGAGLAWQSRAYAAVFRDEDALWTYTLRRNPDAWAAHYNLATYLAHRGEWERSASEYTETLRLRPAFFEARVNFGNVLAYEGRPAEAAAQYEEALRLNPAYADARVGLGNLLARAHRLPEAIAEYAEALRLRPDYAEVRTNLGNALFIAGRTEEAIVQYEEALRQKPGDLRTQRSLEVARQALRGDGAEPR